MVVLAVVTTLGMGALAAGDGGPPRKLNILFVAPFNRDLPAQIAIEEGLDRQIRFREGAQNAYFEFLDSSRIPAADTGAWLQTLTRTKYATIHFDIVVSYDWPAVICVARNHTAFAGARRLYAGVPANKAEELRRLDDGADIISTHFRFSEPLLAALALTGANRIYVAGDDRSFVGRAELAEFRDMAAAVPATIPIENLSGLRFDDVVARAATLPPGSLIWYLLTFDDGNGGKFRPYDMAARLAERASVPVFSQWESLLGSEVVGGPMVSSERTGEIIGAAILGNPAPAGSNLRTTYDWRQLQRWHLTSVGLPPDAFIRFRAPGAWDQYRYPIIGIAAAMTVLAGLLLLLARVAWLRETAARHLATERRTLAARVEERTAALDLERRSLADLLELNETILRSSPVAMGVYLASGPCVMANEAMAAMTGLPRETLLAQDFRRIESWQGSGLAARCELSLATSARQQAEIAMVSSGGRKIWCDCLILPARLRGERHVLLQFVDLTERKETEARLIEARQAADQANRSKSAFLAMMSHEIRTPMTGVMGMADVLARTRLDPAQRSYLDIMQASARTLLTVLNDILDYSKIGADRLTLDKVCFDAVVAAAETVSLFVPKAEENGCTLDLDTGGIERLPVRGDPVRLRQVLANLISNAVKFTRDGRIVVRFRHEPDADGFRLSFEVDDTGVGMSAAELERLFQPFSQADASTTRKFGGTGLGLAISKRLVNLMGGEIAASSQPGAGSVFRFTCVAGRGDAAELVAAAPRRVVPSMSILVAEDNPINGMIAKLGLEQRQHRVTLVANGAVALAVASRERHDMILMDMQMPVMDGAEATVRIRALPAPFSDVPIVAVTADAVGVNREACMQSGLTDFLTKPIDWDELDRVLARHHPRAGPPPEPRAREGCGPLTVLDNRRLTETRTMVSAPGFARMMAELAPHSRASLKLLHEAMAADNLIEVKSIGHSLKGLFLQFGAPRAADAAKRIEGAGDLDAARVLIGVLDAAVEEVLVEVERDWCGDAA